MCYIKLEASESASANHHDKKSVLGISCKNPDRSKIPKIPKHEWILLPFWLEIEFIIFRSSLLDAIQLKQIL